MFFSAWSDRNKHNIAINSLYDPKRLAKAGFLRGRFKGCWTARYEKHLPLHFQYIESLRPPPCWSHSRNLSHGISYSAPLSPDLCSPSGSLSPGWQHVLLQGPDGYNTYQQPRSKHLSLSVPNARKVRIGLKSSERNGNSFIKSVKLFCELKR